VQLVSTGELRGVALRFHKRGRDGSGKCSVVTVEESDETVHGAVYRLTRVQVEALDRIESLGRGYERHVTEVHVASVGVRRCFTYVAMSEFVDDRLVPFSWYAELVVLGARYHGFPAEYIAGLERQIDEADPDARRSEEERVRISRMRRT
jgi:hypothetical protein